MDGSERDGGNVDNGEGPVRLRRNKSNTPLSTNSQNQASGTLTFETQADLPGPVSRSGSTTPLGQGQMKGLFSPNIRKALSSGAKKSSIEVIKHQPRPSPRLNSDLDDLLSVGLGGRSNRTQPDMFFTGGAMDAMNIRGAQGPRKRGPAAEMNVRAFQEHTRLMERRRHQLNASAETKEGVSLIDLAFIDNGIPYPPVVVPFLLTDNQVEDETNGKSRKFSTKFVDEANRNAGQSLFATALNDVEEEKDPEAVEWFLMQFPWRLPEGPGGAKNVSDLPSGRIGEFLIRESGRVELVFNKMDGAEGEPVQLDVNVGAESAFYQQVASYDTKNNEIVFLGDLTKRMVLTPQLSDVIN